MDGAFRLARGDRRPRTRRCASASARCRQGARAVAAAECGRSATRWSTRASSRPTPWAQLDAHAALPRRRSTGGVAKYAGAIRSATLAMPQQVAALVAALPRARRPRPRRRAASTPTLEDFRWLLEELRVSLFAQELRTPLPVSFKRVEKAWQTLDG